MTLFGESFPKSARLLHSRDFRFRRYRRFEVGEFRFVYQSGGKGRLGISVSKKSLKSAVGRNRVRRLAKESFRLRQKQLSDIDVHIVGMRNLKGSWKTLDLRRMGSYFETFMAERLKSR